MNPEAARAAAVSKLRQFGRKNTPPWNGRVPRGRCDPSVCLDKYSLCFVCIRVSMNVMIQETQRRLVCRSCEAALSDGSVPPEPADVSVAQINIEQGEDKKDRERE